MGRMKSIFRGAGYETEELYFEEQNKRFLLRRGGLESEPPQQRANDLIPGKQNLPKPPPHRAVGKKAA